MFCNNVPAAVLTLKLLIVQLSRTIFVISKLKFNCAFQITSKLWITT